MIIIKDQGTIKERIKEISDRFAEGGENIAQIRNSVLEILQNVQNNRLKAVQEYNAKFNKYEGELWANTRGYYDRLENSQKKAIALATERIRRYQKALLPEDLKFNYGDNDKFQLIYRPIESVGIYIPGGAAPLLSTVMMTVILAQTAGVKNIVLASPPPVHDYILAVANYLGVERILQVGGAQSIGALAYGLPEIGLEPVDKICGPGNYYVTLAKKEVYGICGIDALYGPSELVIVADAHKSKPHSIACDLMSQLEHGSGLEAGVLLTDNADFAETVLKEFETILAKHPNAKTIKRAWQNYGLIGVVDSLEYALELVNIFAPEHLELKVNNSEQYLPLLQNAGAVFLENSNEAFGDYVAGPSHCLPTGRSARYSSGLSVYEFLKRISVNDLSPDQELIEATALLARMEGLEAHASAAESL